MPEREEAILDLEVQSGECPRTFFDVTVRHLPGNADRLRTASRNDGSVNAEAEADKRSRYPEGVAPWRVVPLAHETCGRVGPSALAHLKKLARAEVAKVGGDEAWGSHSLLVRRGARLSVALHRANARAVRRASDAAVDARARWLEAGCLDA